MLVASHCEGPVGTVVLNGSPLSYWAGESGANPMRLAGGLLGGSWMANLLADLGDGRFDGAWLIQNFENLKPEAAVWKKYANLYLDVDRQEERFLDFERWWNAWYSFSREEIVEIVDHLFIGNELEQGTLNLGDDVKIDLRRLRQPLVIFASYGDNITPPYQALAWLNAVYKTTATLKEAGQRIVYLINPHVGHLGLFVSASVARFEHRAILESLNDVEALAPGLCIRCAPGRYLLSEKFSPWMRVTAAMAEQVRKNRVTVPDGHPLRAAERAFSRQVANAIETVRQSRDNVEEESFRWLYG